MVRVPAGVIQAGDTIRYYRAEGGTDYPVLRVLPPVREGEAGRWAVEMPNGSKQAIPFSADTTVILVLPG